MSYPLFMLGLFGTLFLLWLLFQAWRHRRARRLERELSAMVFPDSSRAFLRRIAHYNALEEDERERIERMILRCVHTASFEGVRLQITQEMKTLIAFFAALTVLHKGEAWLRELKRVVVYAEDFIFEEEMEYEGVVTRGPFVLDGQSDGDTLVFAWAAVREEAYGLYPSNVVIHEFAHMLDALDGAADGVPPLEEGESAEWEAVMTRSYDTLLEALEKGDDANETALLFGEDGALDEGEFFAVASEFFFMCPARLHADFPELFGALEKFYGVDPRRWGVEAETQEAEETR